MRLEQADIEAIAERVVQLLATSPRAVPVRYVDAAGLARVLAVERDWVYAHAVELGAVRLGGPRGRLRFDIRRVEHTLARGAERPAHHAPAGVRASPGRSSEGLELLPYES